MLHDLRNIIGTDINIGPSHHQQHACRRTLDQTASCFEDGDASSFRTDQGARDMKAAFGEQVVQVVSGDATWNVGKPAPHLVPVAICDRPKARVDFGATATFANVALE